MDQFVRRENIRHFRRVLEEINDENERQRVLKLLAEEEARVSQFPPLSFTTNNKGA